jgi:hypothetical protein
MTGTQIFGLVLGALMLAGLVYAYYAASALLRDGRESRRYRALLDEERAREIALRAEVDDLEVRAAMSELDDEINDLFS